MHTQKYGIDICDLLLTMGSIHFFLFTCNILIVFLDKKFKDVKSKITMPREATNDILSIVHTDEYLESLKVCYFFEVVKT